MRTSPFVLGVGLLLVAVAQRAPGDTFEFFGATTEIVLAEGRERTLLSGGARVVSNEVVLQADEIELYGDDFRFAQTNGSVVVDDRTRGLSIRADDLLFDRETENSRARGDVTVEDTSNDLLLRGGFLETVEGGDLVFVQIGVRVLRDDLTARAQFLRYRRNDEVLELSGFPVVYWQGDEYRATRIILNLETEEIELQGDVQGEIVVEEETPDENVGELVDDASQSDGGVGESIDDGE